MTHSVFILTTLMLLGGCLPVPDTSNPLAEDKDGDGITVLDGDCDDADPARLNGRWYADGDGDGHFGGQPLLSCEPIDGRSEVEDDCDDVDAEVFVGVAAEDPAACMRDADGDGFGDASPTSGAVQAGTDCDDADAAKFPGAATEEPDVCALDGDGDGWGAQADGGSDCDDSDLRVHPDGTGACGVDADADGWVRQADGGGDCNDRAATIHPDATEVFSNGVDDDCDVGTLASGVYETLDAEDIAFIVREAGLWTYMRTPNGVSCVSTGDISGGINMLSEELERPSVGVDSIRVAWWNDSRYGDELRMVVDEGGFLVHGYVLPSCEVSVSYYLRGNTQDDWSTCMENGWHELVYAKNVESGAWSLGIDDGDLRSGTTLSGPAAARRLIVSDREDQSCISSITLEGSML